MSLTILLTATLAAAQNQDKTFELDIAVVGGMVYDGTGAAGVRTDVGVVGDRIAVVGDLTKWKTKRTIDATRKIVCPGFIDLHTHSDDPILAKKTRQNLNYLTQGCTTVVTGNCGGGHVDVGGYFGKMETNGIGTNVAHLIPHGSVRKKAMGGSFNRRPSEVELDRIRQITEKAMSDGAVGMSTGLIYTPGMYADVDEIVEMAKVVAASGGFYATHMRSESEGLVRAVDEALTIGQRSRCPVHISHLKASTPPAWGKTAEACEHIEAARAKNEKVTADQYPYTASSTGLVATTMPGWAREGSERDMLRRIDDPQEGPRIRDEITRSLERRGGADKIHIASFDKQPAWNGMSLDAIAKSTGRTPTDSILDILRRGGASVISHSMCDKDVEYVMKKDFVATASDGSSRCPDSTIPHPRSYGTFPRKIGRYALEMGVLPLEQAIRSATSLPADILGLRDRGKIVAEAFADIVVLDPQSFRDVATFGNPHQYSTGVTWLLVNGVVTIADSRPLDVLPGRVIRNARRPPQ